MKSIFKAVGYVLFYVIFQVVFMSIAAASMRADQSGAERFMRSHLMGLTVVTNVLTILLIAVFFRLRRKKLSAEVPLGRVGLRGYRLSCAAAFSFSAASSLLTYHMSFENAEQIQASAAYYSSLFPNLGTFVKIAALLIAAPATEEFLFRGLVLTALQRRYSAAVSVGASALLFGAIHLMAGGAVLAAIAAGMGVILGIITVKTRSILPAVAAHALANTPDFILPLFPGLPQTAVYLSAGVFFAVCCAAVYGLLTGGAGGKP